MLGEFGVTCSDFAEAGLAKDSVSDTDPLDSSWGLEHSSSASDVISVDNNMNSIYKIGNSVSS